MNSYGRGAKLIGSVPLTMWPGRGPWGWKQIEQIKYIKCDF